MSGIEEKEQSRHTEDFFFFSGGSYNVLSGVGLRGRDAVLEDGDRDGCRCYAPSPW
ncbi:hypothetical protein DPMN_045769 [Dreissena polymorpha]|uniref:Uncharacterized protein n=1 Tax=Dreissena polymorpha TaxID=45954 RepID=A0A9D4D6N6_DREPO|nr:hypothetical protein DPMN_045769 [Dreissena polymorpha]